MNKHVEEASKPIDISRLNIVGATDILDAEENKTQGKQIPPQKEDDDNNGAPPMPKDQTMMKLYIDQEGFVTFPDGSRYKGGLESGIPEGEGKIVYTD